MMCATVTLGGCEGEKSQVKVAAEPPRLVENGTLHELARVDVHGVAKVVLPKDAIARPAHGPEVLQLFIAKPTLPIAERRNPFSVMDKNRA
jgi:hypothetical protein